MRARLRRTDEPPAESLAIGDVDDRRPRPPVSPATATPIPLTPLEFDLLVALARKPRQVFTREVLLEQVWGYRHAADTRLVNVHVQRLRSKVEQDPEHPEIVADRPRRRVQGRPAVTVGSARRRAGRAERAGRRRRWTRSRASAGPLRLRTACPTRLPADRAASSDVVGDADRAGAWRQPGPTPGTRSSNWLRWALERWRRSLQLRVAADHGAAVRPRACSSSASCSVGAISAGVLDAKREAAHGRGDQRRPASSSGQLAAAARRRTAAAWTAGRRRRSAVRSPTAAPRPVCSRSSSIVHGRSRRTSSRVRRARRRAAGPARTRSSRASSPTCTRPSVGERHVHQGARRRRAGQHRQPASSSSTTCSRWTGRAAAR